MLSALQISIHAPVKGATRIAAGRSRLFRISIHAPVKGATSASLSAGSPASDFNPRSRKGSDKGAHQRTNYQA